MARPIIHKTSFGPSLAGTGFTIERILPVFSSTQVMYQSAIAIGDILLKNWRDRLPDEIPDEDIRNMVPGTIDQMNRLVRPYRNAKYWLAHQGGSPDSDIKADEVNGFLRVEEYKPKRPLKSHYPNITDLESRSGFIRGTFEKQAAALLYFSLGEFDGKSKVAAHELEEGDNIEFFEEFGFERTDKAPLMKVGQSQVTTIHLEAESVELVRSQLSTNYPWLDISDML